MIMFEKSHRKPAWCYATPHTKKIEAVRLWRKSLATVAHVQESPVFSNPSCNSFLVKIANSDVFDFLQYYDQIRHANLSFLIWCMRRLFPDKCRKLSCICTERNRCARRFGNGEGKWISVLVHQNRTQLMIIFRWFGFIARLNRQCGMHIAHTLNPIVSNSSP